MWYIFFDEQELYSQENKNYKEDTTASSLMIISKQGRPKPTSKDPKTLFKKDHLAREWAALFAPLGI